MSATDIQKSVMLDKITPQHADLLTKRLQSLTEGAYQGNAAMAKDADRRLRLPPTDPEAITDFNTLTAEYNGGKNMGLDKSHLDRFAKVYLAPKDADQGIKDQMGALSDAAAKSLIKPTQVPWGDKQGLAQWGKAVNYMHNDYQAKMQSGKYTSDQLLNPSSKDYIGKAVEQFQRSNSEVTQHAISSQFDSSSINADKTIAQPVGANGKFTPMPVNKSSANGAPPALSPKVQAIVDQISGRFKKKEAK
jgi:hypothetical protein